MPHVLHHDHRPIGSSHVRSSPRSSRAPRPCALADCLGLCVGTPNSTPKWMETNAPWGAQDAQTCQKTETSPLSPCISIKRMHFWITCILLLMWVTRNCPKLSVCARGIEHLPVSHCPANMGMCRPCCSHSVSPEDSKVQASSAPKVRLGGTCVAAKLDVVSAS